MYCVECCVGQQEGVGVGKPYVFACQYHEPAGDKLGLFASLYHACQVVDGCVGIAAAHTLDECRYEVVVHLAVLVVCQRVLLQALCHELVGYDVGLVGHEFEYVEQFSGIAAAISHHGARLTQLYGAFLQVRVGVYHPLCQLHEVVLVERIEHIHLAAAEERTYDFERGVLGRGTYECHHSSLHSTEQRVLLRLREPVYFVDEEYGVASLTEESAALGLLYHLAHLLHSARHGAERIERHLERVCNDSSQRGLPHPGRSPQDERCNASRFNHATYHRPLAHEVALSDVVVERLRTHSLCQWLHTIYQCYCHALKRGVDRRTMQAGCKVTKKS